MSADYWALESAGYSLSAKCFWSQGQPVHCLEVHSKQLEKLGGTSKSPQFESYATGLMKERGLCPAGWKRHTSGTGASLGYGTRYSYVMTFECT